MNCSCGNYVERKIGVIGGYKYEFGSGEHVLLKSMLVCKNCGRLPPKAK